MEEGVPPLPFALVPDDPRVNERDGICMIYFRAFQAYKLRVLQAEDVRLAVKRAEAEGNNQLPMLREALAAANREHMRMQVYFEDVELRYKAWQRNEPDRIPRGDNF